MINETVSPIFKDPKVLEELKITTIHKDTPVYLEIYRRLRRLITSGMLRYGEPLPSELDLAEMMGVGRTSLRTALTILYEDGCIKTLRGKGSYVSYDKRVEKYRRLNPSGIIFPQERLALLGEVSADKPFFKTIDEDDFLIDKLSPLDGEKINSYFRLYRLDGKPAIYSCCYYLDDLICENINDFSADEIGQVITDNLKEKAVVVECECVSVPARVINMQDIHPKFSGDNHILVISTFVDENNQVIACSKDYYNDEMIRFRCGLRK